MASHNDKTSVVDADSHFIIDPVTRTIQNDGEKNLVQFDHNSERKTFECPRFVEGHDMLNCNRVIVNYLDNDLPGVYEVDDLTMKDTNTVMFSWLISSNATQKTGNIFFAITFMCVQTNGDVTYRWNTAINQGLKVIEGMNQNSTIVYDNVDILEQWKQQLFGTSDGEISKIQKATNECLKQIPSDYSDLNTKVDKNTTSISELKESIKNATVTDGSITTSKIKDGAVTYDKLGIVKKQSDDSSETLQTNENLIQYDSSRDVCYVDLNNVPDKLYTIHAIRGGGYIKCAQLKYSADYYDSVAAYGNFTNAVKIEDISDLTNIYCCEIDLTAIKEKALSGSKIYPNNYVIVYYTTLNNPSANGYKLTKSSYDSDGLPYVCTKITKQSLTAYLQGKKYTFGIDDSDDSNDSDDLSDIDSNFVKLIKRINLATTITPDKTSTEYPHYGKKAILFGDSNLAYWNNTVTGGYPTKCFNAIGLSCKSYASPGATWYTSTGYVDDVTPNSSTMLGQFNTMKADYPTRNEDNVYLILSGTNDFRPGEISDSAGADGMVGAMKYTLEKIIEYDPTALIIGIIPPHRYDVQTSDETSIGKAYLTMEQKIPMIKQIYDSFSVPYINLYESSNIRIGDLKEDKIHLNVSGYSKLQRLIWATVNGH